MAIPRAADLVLDVDMENLVDRSKSGVTVTNTGSTQTNDQLNRLNKARDFTPAGQHVDLGAGVTLSGDFTIEMWVNPNAYYNTYNMCLSNPASAIIYAGFRSTGPWMTITPNSTERNFATHTTPTDRWNHVVFTRISGTIRAYQDGIESVTGGIVDATSVTYTEIGDYFSSAYDLDAQMGTLRMWDVGLTDGEVKQLYSNSSANYNDLFRDCELYLDMNGDAKDVTNNNNDGTVTGATLTTDHLGIANRAYTFNGSSQYITATQTYVLASNSYTWLFWAKTSDVSPASNMSPFGYNPSAGFGANNAVTYLRPDTRWHVQFNTPTHYHWFGATGVDVSGVISNDTWHHIALVWTANTNLKLYIDGVLIATSTSGGASYGASTNVFSIGRNGGSASGYWNGEISTFTTIDRALSIDQVKNHYQLTSQKYIYPYPKVTGE